VLTWEVGQSGARPVFVVPALVAGLLLGIGVLSGCQGSDGQDPGPPVTAASSPDVSASPSGTSTPAPPTAPPPRRTAKGAEAFVRYFWEVYNYTYASQDTRLLTSISAPTCVFCKATTIAVEDLSKKGQRVAGAKISVKAATAPPGDLRRGAIVVTVISEEPGRTVSRDGSLISTTKGVRDMKSEIALDRRGNRWVVADLANDEESGKPW
jgi:hypothetical protein